MDRVELKEKVFRKKGKKCVYCDCNNFLIMTIDHIVPKIEKGENTVENCNPCCAVCNQLKGRLSHPNFKKYLRALIVLKKLKKIDFAFTLNGVNLTFHQNNYPSFYEDEKKKKEEAMKSGTDETKSKRIV